MKDSVKMNIVLIAPTAVGFFGSAYFNRSMHSPGMHVSWFDMLLLMIQKPSVKKGLVGGGIGFGCGFFMYMLIQFCTAEARQKSRDYHDLESRLHATEQRARDLEALQTCKDALKVDLIQKNTEIQDYTDMLSTISR